MEPGTGKTKVALDIATSRASSFDEVAWIAPASLLRDAGYKKEVERWNTSDLPINYFSIEGVSQSDRSFLKLRELAKKADVFCIIDESLKIKNGESKRTKRLLDMWNKFKFRLILNGTPLSKGLVDLYSQINFLHPKILNMTEAQFASNFLTYRKEGSRPWWRWSKPENEEALIEILRPYIFDAKLDLSISLCEEDIFFSLSTNEREAYQKEKEAFLEDKEEVDFLAMAQKFQQAYSVTKSKINWLKKKISTGEKWIVCVKFHRELDAMLEIFPEALEYSGRNKCNIEDFTDGDGQVLIMTYGTGSMGLNLQSCSNLVFFSQTFDWAQKAQASRRVYRIGQKDNVNIYSLWVRTGLDEIIKTSLDKKTSVSQNVARLISVKEAMAL